MYDVFISHASEDKNQVARPLSSALQNRGLSVWYDEFTLKIGDSLRRTVDNGLTNSRYGIVIISPSFISKEWPKRELDGLFARENNNEKAILPIWHNVTYEDVLNFSPALADRLAVSTDRGIDAIVDDVLNVFKSKERTTSPIQGLLTAEHEQALEEYRAFFRDADRRKFSFLIVGRSGVGKSSTINSFIVVQNDYSCSE